MAGNGVRRPPGRPQAPAHPVAMAVAAGLALVASYLVARPRPAPDWEVDLTRRVADTPGWVADGLWPVMQVGTVWAPLLAALVVGVVRRDWVLGACVVVGGLAAWLGAKLVKELVERPRPKGYAPDIVARDGWASGFGYLSGHSAVAAATATVLVVAVPRRARPLLVLVAILVGLARVVHGVHFPADVVGGWSFGVLVGLGVLAIYERCSVRGTRAHASNSQSVTS